MDEILMQFLSSSVKLTIRASGSKKVKAQIDAKLAQMPSFQTAVRLLDTIPGVERHLAILIVAGIGVDMNRLPSDQHLTDWAGESPGNQETSGKRRSGKTRKGNRCLEQGLVLAA
jgi:transposase